MEKIDLDKFGWKKFSSESIKYDNHTADKQLLEKINEIVDWINEHEKAPIQGRILGDIAK